MITPKLNILFYTSQLPRFFVPKGLWAKGVIWSTQQRKLSYVDITFFCSFCSRRAVFASLTGKLLGFPIWWLSCICVYGIVIFGRHILHILSMKNKTWQPIALTSPSCFVSCHKPSPWGKRVSGWCIARLRGKASRRCTEPGSLEQRGLQGRGPRDAGTKGEGGMRLGRLEQRQGLAETLCCLTAKRLARVLGKWSACSILYFLQSCTLPPSARQHRCGTWAALPGKPAAPGTGDTTQTPQESSRFPAQVIYRPWIPTAIEGREWGPTPSSSRPELEERRCQWTVSA